MFLSFTAHFIPMRLAVVGATGLVGDHLMKEAESRGLDVLGTYLTNRQKGSSFSRLDITDKSEMREVLARFRPEGVILTAAVSDVDQCELNPNEAWLVNVEGALNLTEFCAELECPLLFVSTDYVFNGLKGFPYSEGDAPDPISFYGRTKLEGERLVLDASPLNLVTRVSVVFGWRGNSTRDNLVLKILRRLRAGKEVELFNDQWNSPTYAPGCASLMLDLLSRDRGLMEMFEGDDRSIFHLSGKDCLTRYELGLRVAEIFDLDSSLIRSIGLEEADLVGPRPRMSCLSVAKVEAKLNTRIASLNEALEDMRSKEGEG